MLDNSESELIAKAQAGDSASFGGLYDIHFSWIRRLIYSRIANLEDADDLTQETFLRALQALPRFDSVRSFRGWLTGIAQNVVNGYLRDKYQWDEGMPEIAQNFVQQNLFVTTEIDEKIDLQNFLLELQAEASETLYRIFTMRLIEKHSTEEVAQALYGETSQEARHRVSVGLYKALALANNVANRLMTLATSQEDPLSNTHKR